jgi:hypothetical protein
METISSMNEGMDNLKEIEDLKKEIALVREDAQIEYLKKDKKLIDTVFKMDNRIKELETINKHHQRINGELQTKLSKYEDKAAHFRRKGVL